MSVTLGKRVYKKYESKYGKDYSQFLPTDNVPQMMDLGAHVEDQTTADILRNQGQYSIDIYNLTKRTMAMIEILESPCSNLVYSKKQAYSLIEKLSKSGEYELIHMLEQTMFDPGLMEKRNRGKHAKKIMKEELARRVLE